MRRLFSLAIVLVPLAALGEPMAKDKPVPTKDAAAKFTVPPGFNVQLFAGEPDVVQPIAFTFDDRGRMWVVECLSYPKWRADGTGNDRVIILEDTDGDGRHDKKTVVIDNGSNLSGIELGFGGVYLCSTPNLIFIPLEHDKPSGLPQILLDGWNLKEAKHNVFNGLIWGPDGWLYGCNGIQTKSWVGAPGTPQDKRTYLDCGVWRFHPTRKTFEVVATGTTNPWGLDFDESGEMFITNCVIDHLWHVVPGGRYERMYGQDSNPFTFGLIKSAVDYRHWAGGHWTDSRFDKATGTARKDHGDAGGGHAHSGCAIYLGDNFPKEYRNTLFTCNIHGNRLNNDGLVPTSTGMKGVRRPDFAFANDPWFRGICVKQGPDGALYVSDWSDTGECHNYDVADVSNGRIYRIAYGNPKTFDTDLSLRTTQDLVQDLLSTNEWIARKARRILHERSTRDNRVLAAVSKLKCDPSKPNAASARKKAWAVATIGGFKADNFADFLRETTDQHIPWTGRHLLQAAFEAEIPQASDIFAAIMTPDHPYAKKYPLSAWERAVVYQRAPVERRLDLAKLLMTNPADNAEDKLTQLYWLGIQPAVVAKPKQALKLLNSLAVRRVRTNIVRQVAILPDSDQTKQLEQVLPFLDTATTDEVREDILTGLRLAYEDRKSLKAPMTWSTVYSKLSANPRLQDAADELALKFGDSRAVDTLKARVADSTIEAARRASAIQKLATMKAPGLADLLFPLISDPAVRGSVIRALAVNPADGVGLLLLKNYASFTADEKADAILTFTSRPQLAALLLEAVEKGTIPKRDITAFAARQIVALNKKNLTDQLGRVWGTVKSSNANRTEQTARIKTLLKPDYLAAARLDQGKALYAKSCAACHKLFGDGGDVGPELTGSQRTNLDYLLENVLDPNAVVPFDYKMTQFNLHDGRVVTGLIKNETPAAVTVRTVNELLVISKEDIEVRKPTNNSVMPEGLFDNLKDDELRDLIAYLMRKD